MDTTYTHLVPVDDDGVAWQTRTEVLKKIAAVQFVDRELLEAEPDHVADMVQFKIRETILRECEKAGRMPHGDAVMTRHDDHLRNAVMFRAEIMTRESTEGSWPSIHEALRQDEEDRREALRHPPADLED